MSDVLAAIVEAAATVAASVITVLIAMYLPRFVAAFETWTGVQLTEQQSAALQASAATAAGILQTKIDQGILRVTHIDVRDPNVLAEAQAAIARAPNAAVATNQSVPAMAATIVGMVDTSAKAVPLNPPLTPIPVIPAGLSPTVKGPIA